jgi:hypothetical protein
MANHVESLTTASSRAEPRRPETAGATLLVALWHFGRRKPLGALGGIIVLALIVVALLAPWARTTRTTRPFAAPA